MNRKQLQLDEQSSSLEYGGFDTALLRAGLTARESEAA